MNRRQIIPDDKGRFGKFGGQFVPETLMGPLKQLEEAYQEAKTDEQFHMDLKNFGKDVYHHFLINN